MRTIKFRVWNKVNSVMYYQLKDSPCFGQFEGDRAVSIEDVFFHEPQDFSVMQSTGLKEKNGVEIYEGDILGWSYNVWGGGVVEELSVVKWDETDACFDFGDDSRPDFCKREVIGNIYENAELFEGGK